jgi:ribonucleoside-diphosphate reductase alpha chain
LEENMSNGTKVIKRNGAIEPLDLDKMHLMVEEACRGLAGVSASQVEMTSGIQFYDGISTEEIQEILIRSASDLIDLDHPNYQFVAARLLLFSVRKQLYGKMKELPPLEQHIYQCVNHEVYDRDIFTKYSKEEIQRSDSYIDHDRDYLFTYAGLRQIVDKYLVQDRSGGGVYETPQFMYMMISLTIFAEYPKETRMSYVRRYYDAISKHKINIPTPIMAGVRTPLRQFASCVLVDIDDTLDSIFSSDMAIGRYVSQRAGIGINAGRIRGINSKIRGGEVQHTGVVPFLKKFESTVRCCTQNGIRGGSATVHFPIWHQEIGDILLSLRIIKELKTIVFANLTIQFNLVKFSMKDLFRIVRLHFSPHMMCLDYMMLLEQTRLTTSMLYMKKIRPFQKRLLKHRNSFLVSSKNVLRRDAFIL